MDNELVKSFAEFLQELDTMVDGAKDVAKNTITQEASDMRDRILDNLNTSHTNTGNLAKSLKLSKKGGKSSYFGYKFSFDGYDNKGRPYQVIANSLDKGRRNQDGTMTEPSYFFSNAIPPLRELNPKIIRNVDEYLENKDT